MASPPLITPSECAVVLVDYQAGLAFAAGSADRQGIRSAALALAKTAKAFSVPVVVSTSATKVYSGPLMPPLRAVLTHLVPIERRNMNLWEDEAAKAAVVADACGGLTPDSHWAALQRMQQAGAVLTSWLHVLLEFLRDWTRRETYEAARAIVVEHAGGYGIGLDYARDMIKPA